MPLVPRPVMPSSLWVASTKPGAALVRGQGWLPWQGRGWFLAPRDRGPEADARCRTGHLVGLVVVGALGDAHGDPGDDRLLRALVQALAAPLDRGQELVQVDLERREDRVCPVLPLEPRLARLAAGGVAR